VSGHADTLLLAFDDEQPLAQALAAALGCGFAQVQRHAFPDGETRLRLPPQLPPRVLLLRGLQQPNARLTELMLTAAGARELGADRLALVAPYLGYMRQDMAFVPGEVVSQRHLGRALAAWFDTVVTVDPHLHRVPTLDAVLPGRRGIALTAAPLLGAWIAAQRPGALLLGPDEEAVQWVRAAAEPHGLAHAVCVKQRRGDREVEVVLPAVDLAGRDVVLLDDVASTGRTLVQAARAALAAGARGVDVAVTHALFVGDALAEVRAAGVRTVWSSDCVPHASNAVSVVPLLASALAAWLDGAAPSRAAAGAAPAASAG
jgi:ribose-phosphate pyrophosphokinase